jgi:hypothetical protein
MEHQAVNLAVPVACLRLVILFRVRFTGTTRAIVFTFAIAPCPVPFSLDRSTSLCISSFIGTNLVVETVKSTR